MSKLKNERSVEVPWVNARIAGKKLLDVGCTKGTLAIPLAQKGYKVYGIDVRGCGQKHPNFIFYQEDIVHNHLPANFFDTVYAISTLEHVGVGRYGDPKYEDGDKKALEQIKRAVRPKGRILVTVPFGIHGFVPNFYRVYDENDISDLFSSLEVVQRDYFAKENGVWRESCLAEAGKVDSVIDGLPRAVCCISATKRSPSR